MKDTSRAINPQKFSLWLSMGGILMMFAGFTSAYIVKQAAGNWLEFPLPNYFYISAFVMLASSVMLHLSLREYKAQNESKYKGYLVGSFIFGIGFLVSQFLGWIELFENGVDFKVNVSGSFLYIITGVHFAHVLGGIIALILALVHAYTLKFEYKEFRKNRFELIVQYWHFVDLLWIAILLFLLFSK